MSTHFLHFRVELGNEIHGIGTGIVKIAINVAIERGYYDIADYLIQKGADLERSDNSTVVSSPSAPLMKFCDNGNFQAVQYLVEKGANVNLSIYGLTPLMFAAGPHKKTQDHLEIVKYLLKNGVSLDRDRQAESALGQAGRHRNLDVVKFFTQIGVKSDSISESLSGIVSQAQQDPLCSFCFVDLNSQPQKLPGERFKPGDLCINHQASKIYIDLREQQGVTTHIGPFLPHSIAGIVGQYAANTPALDSVLQPNKDDGQQLGIESFTILESLEKSESTKFSILDRAGRISDPVKQKLNTKRTTVEIFRNKPLQLAPLTNPDERRPQTTEPEGQQPPVERRRHRRRATQSNPVITHDYGAQTRLPEVRQKPLPRRRKTTNQKFNRLQQIYGSDYDRPHRARPEDSLPSIR